MLCLPCLATTAQAIDPHVRSCVQRNELKTTAIQKVELRSIDRAGYEKILVADIYLKRFPDETTRMVAYFKEPDDIANTRLLIIEKPPGNEMYMYMPSLFKIRRISSKRISSSMYGSDFSYEDIERFYGMLSSEQPVQAPDTVLNGQPMYVLETRPAEDSGSRYETIVAYFNQRDCIVRRVDYFEPGGKLRKQLMVNEQSMETTGTISLPREFTMTDLRNNTETTLHIRHLELGIPIDDSAFDWEQLKQFRGIK